MHKPLAIDLFTGLHGWTDGLVAEGWRVIGFDLEDMSARFGMPKPADFQLILQDVLTLVGSQFRGAELIVASPPCQFFSYTAMPWTRAKRLAESVRADPLRLEKELALFRACFRLQREACESAGRHIPMIVENVRGAQPWVGQARWMFGSFALWGDVPALMPATLRAMKRRKTSGKGQNLDGRKAPGTTAWFNDAPRTRESLASSGSKSHARKFASAMIAKIPLPLSRYIARTFYPANHLKAA